MPAPKSCPFDVCACVSRTSFRARGVCARARHSPLTKRRNVFSKRPNINHADTMNNNNNTTTTTNMRRSLRMHSYYIRYHIVTKTSVSRCRFAAHVAHFAKATSPEAEAQDSFVRYVHMPVKHHIDMFYSTRSSQHLRVIYRHMCAHNEEKELPANTSEREAEHILTSVRPASACVRVKLQSFECEYYSSRYLCVTCTSRERPRPPPALRSQFHTNALEISAPGIGGR